MTTYPPALVPLLPLAWSWGAVIADVSDLALLAAGKVGGVVLVVILALVALRLLRRVVVGFVARIMERGGEPSAELTKKANTLADVVLSTGRLMVVLIAGMMILSNLGLDIGPLIASAGIAGVALGLGAQSLIRDMINGFFILSEDQFGVGDWVTIGGFTGTVEEISLRRTVLRAADGSVIYIPNGQILTVSNQSKGWANAVVEIVVLPEADEEQVIAALRQALEGIEDDPKIGAHIVGPAQILGITNIAPTGVTYRAIVKTRPLQHWAVERELRRRVLQHIRAQGIPLPSVVSGLLPRVE